jgi:hypothetical protein
MSPVDVAKETVKGLSDQPMLLLIAVLNVAMLATLLFVAKSNANERHELRQDDQVMIRILTDMCAKR